MHRIDRKPRNIERQPSTVKIHPQNMIFLEPYIFTKKAPSTGTHVRAARRKRAPSCDAKTQKPTIGVLTRFGGVGCIKFSKPENWRKTFFPCTYHG